jgi:HSP20 family protein
MGETSTQVQVRSPGDARQEKRGEVTYRPPMDLLEFEDKYEIHLDIPGSTTESISVTVDESVLTVEAGVPARHAEGAQDLLREYGVGDYRRRIRLGEDVEAGSLSARYVSGVLSLTLPKRPERQARRVPISGA